MNPKLLHQSLDLTTEMVFKNWKIFRCHQGLKPNLQRPSPPAVPLDHHRTIKRRNRLYMNIASAAFGVKWLFVYYWRWDFFRTILTFNSNLQKWSKKMKTNQPYKLVPLKFLQVMQIYLCTKQLRLFLILKKRNVAFCNLPCSMVLFDTAHVFHACVLWMYDKWKWLKRREIRACK